MPNKGKFGSGADASQTARADVPAAWSGSPHPVSAPSRGRPGPNRTSSRGEERQSGVPQGVRELTLPKGGGALRGIGEKLSVNPATGTASLAVPLPLTPAREGMTPALSLAYGSGGGLGPFGMGWAIDVPRIGRSTEKGLPRYRDGEDIFQLSGAEDLVPARRFDGQSWVRVVRRDGAFTVTRYVPRQEGAFQRIELWEGPAGDSHWRSIGSDNVTSFFGVTAASRIADPRDPSRIFAWLLCEVRNDRGDLALYHYKAEDDEGLPNSVAERNRRRGEAVAQRYLKRVEYGAHAPQEATSAAAPDFHFQIVIDYGEHDPQAPSPSENGRWACRADASSDFRAGFEIRTRRLARRVLVFHKFAELGPAPVLTRSLDLDYEYDPAGAKLTSLVQRAWDASGLPSQRPKLSFAYSRGVPDPIVRRLEGDSADNLPEGVDGVRFRFVDLFEEGAPGILVDEAGAWFFKRNGGEGRLEPLELVAAKPNWANLGGRAELAQLEADGRLYAVTRADPAGYAARDGDGGWEPFRPFLEDAAIDWADPSLRHADLDGDGRAEVLLLRDEVIRWYSNGGRGGYGAEARALTGLDEEAGPARVLTNRLEGIFLADMTGDGLSDIVRVRNGEVCYWPNLGFGRFGAKVGMDAAPHFDHPDLFDPGRLRLGDIDGSGTTDLLYLGREECRWWLNLAGNSWSAATPVATGFPSLDPLTRVDLVDLMGIGTSCLVWSSARPHDQARPLQFVDLMGGMKPYLLTAVDNGSGARSTIEYRSSAAYYRDDRRDGRPWRTRLPFPVQVVRRITHEDLVSGGRLASEYSYRHGHYDHAEREFRGFAMVEQRDAETVAGPLPSDLPPVLTRTWYHTGALTVGSLTDAFGDEYFQSALRLPDSRLEGAASPRDQREACRALRGQMLRQEIYSLDGSAAEDQPYQVTETRCVVRRLQPSGGGEREYGVFVAHPIETLSQHVERDAQDPRIAHELVLDRDDFGNPLRSFQVAYARKAARRPTDPALDFVAQAQGGVVATLLEEGFAQDVAQPHRYRHSLPVWSTRFEVSGVEPDGEIFGLEEARRKLDAIAGFLPFEQVPGAGPARRLLGASVHLYRSDASAGADPMATGALGPVAMPLGLVDPLALPYRTYSLALTDGLVASTIGGRLAAAGIDLAQDGYEARSFGVTTASGSALALEGWWTGSPLQSFAASGFYRPVKSRDPYGAVWEIGYDSAWLAPVALVDPLGGVTSATLDRRHMAPAEIVDSNGNRRLAAYDGFGRVVAVAAAGKAGSTDGDSLASPTERFDYVETEWSSSGRPNYAHVSARETHGDPATRWLETRVYSDGFGRELATKTRVRPGPAHFVQGGVLKSRFANPRWVGSGRTIYDNKGNVLRRYEPYFSVTEAHEEEDELRLWGVSPEMRYDPLGRLMETRFPDLTTSRVRFDAWREESWDRNDTLLPGRPWEKAAAANPSGSREERARALAEVHAGTPGIVHLDTLGRPVLTEEDNKAAATYKTRILLDIEGRQRELWDANGNRALLQVFDMAGQALRTVSNDAGESLALAGADGQPRHLWTPRGHYVRQDYDPMRRPTTRTIVDPGATATVVDERIVYGEAAPNAAVRNLLGRAWLAFDGAGALRNPDYDFKGNAVAQERFAFADPIAVADWSGLPPDVGIDAWLAAQAAVLFEGPYRAETAYDAHERPMLERAPDGSETRNAYDEGGALQSVTLAGVPGRPAAIQTVRDIGYDAKGQRAWIEYGNGVAGFYRYEATTDRLSEMLATRAWSRDSDGMPSPAAAQPAPLQHLLYTYDPVGNIVEIEDLAQDKVYNEGVVEPRRLYEYDALYRLTVARGREHAGQTLGGAQYQAPAALPQTLPADTDMRSLRGYTQRYDYDPVGNIVRMRHIAPGGGTWTRDYVYDYQRANLGIASALPAASHPGNSNRLYSTSLGGAAELYDHDAAGNILALPSIASIAWNHENQPETMRLGTVDAHYRYAGGGERLRKFVDKGNIKEERLYLGDYEIYRRWAGGTLDLRRDTLHVADDERRVLLIETEKDAAGAAAPGKAPVLRYQLDDHLHSACAEADEAGAPISYEEFHPYGTTALHWKNALLSQKRYRYTGMERDEESGLSYQSARYYIPWIARWSSSDPLGAVEGLSLYQYCASDPIQSSDPTGTQSSGSKDGEVMKGYDLPEVDIIDYRPDFFGGFQRFLDSGGKNILMGIAAVVVGVVVAVAAAPLALIGGILLITAGAAGIIGGTTQLATQNQRSVYENIQVSKELELATTMMSSNVTFVGGLLGATQGEGGVDEMQAGADIADLAHGVAGLTRAFGKAYRIGSHYSDLLNSSRNYNKVRNMALSQEYGLFLNKKGVASETFGVEFSHFIPTRHLKRWGMSNFIKNHPLNATLVSPEFHALTDPIRMQIRKDLQPGFGLTLLEGATFKNKTRLPRFASDAPFLLGGYKRPLWLQVTQRTPELLQKTIFHSHKILRSQ